MPDLLTPLRLFLPLHLLAYFIVVLALLLFLAFPGKDGKRHRKGIGYGLLCSPFGLLVPWIIGAVLMYLLEITVKGMLHDVLTVVIFLSVVAGPLVGAPLTIALVTIRLREDSSEAKSADSDAPASTLNKRAE